MNDREVLFTPQEASNAVHGKIGPDGLRAAYHRGDLEATKTAGGRLLFSLAAVRAHVAKRPGPAQERIAAPDGAL